MHGVTGRRTASDKENKNINYAVNPANKFFQGLVCFSLLRKKHRKVMPWYRNPYELNKVNQNKEED